MHWNFCLLISSFSFASIKPVYASAALYKISCSFFWSFALAKSIPILLFDNSAPLPKSRRVCVTLIDFVSGSTSVIVAFEPSLLVSFSVSSSLLLPSKVIDGRIFITGKVDGPEEKLQITKIAWETKGTRSVRNDLKVKEEFNFKQSAKDILITSQLRTAFILSKNIKATNYQIDTYKKKIYIYGIAMTSEERDLVLNEAKEILDVEDVIASILLVEDLRIQKN